MIHYCFVYTYRVQWHSQSWALFDYVKRTREQAEESDGLEQLNSKRRRFEADPDSLTSEHQVPSINRNDHQTNYITVENPSAPTTIVLNTSGASVPLPSLTTAQDDSSSMVSTPSKLPDVAAPVSEVPNDIEPAQPVNLKSSVYIHCSQKSRGHSIQRTWYSPHPWLEYSVKQDACFCYPCRLFDFGGCISSSRPEQAMDLRIGSMQLGRVAFFQATMTVVHTNKLL